MEQQPRPIKVLFLHGWHSEVGGVKPTYLADQGMEILNPALDDDDFELAVRTAQSTYDLHHPDVIVGSSRGGAVALHVRSKDTPLVLLCPAWKRWGKVSMLPRNSIVLHSPSDEVIPFADSEELVANSLHAADLLLAVGSDHRLADTESLSVMAWACRLLAQGEVLPDHEMELYSTRAAQLAQRSGSSGADASYLCDACGEEIVIPIDLSEGRSQVYVEDCPVCCRANTIHVELDEQGTARISAEPEQDR